MAKVESGRPSEADFERIYTESHGRVFGIAKSILGNNQDAEDASQDVFLSTLKKLRAGQLEPGVGPWVAEVAHNRAVDYIRRRARDRSAPLDMDTEDSRSDSPEDDPEEACLNTELRAVLESAKSMLPVKQREVLDLQFQDDKTLKQIARETNTPEGTVKTRGRLGKKNLAELLPTGYRKGDAT